MNFESRISEMNQLNSSDQHLMNNSSTPSNSLFDNHLNHKYPMSPMMNSNYNNSIQNDQMRKNFELWKIEMDENSRKVRKLPQIKLN